ncbi:MAG: TetR/AcrR family transcriptional regulator, partial [Hyphomonadaceae bacterium]
MHRASPSRKRAYSSDLRTAQTELTQRKIQAAAASLLGEHGAADGITVKAVAERAGVTEMTVYRHFPTRDHVLQGLWRHLNVERGPGRGIPERTAE